jgi:DNA-binding beta-propeller fold protein YncE
MALSPDGSKLIVVNTPNNSIEIFSVRPNALVYLTSVPVGMEPVAVAMRNNQEAWVVNHLSDSVSIVSLSPVARVMRTLKVGDEPRDIVFAGPGNERAFIAAANREVTVKDPAPGTKRGAADVWVFDAANPGTSLYGNPIAVVNLFSDVPRALAVSPDGSTVYAAAFQSGNQTTVISGAVVLENGLPPFETASGVPAPRAGLIVKYNGQAWLDAGGRDWSANVAISLPDWDVFSIDAMAVVPAETGRIPSVGTILFNMAVNPASGKIYVSNLESLNHIRFEGPGIHGGSTVRGHMVDNRITVINGTTVMPRDLNKHINFSQFPGTTDENARSLALPLQMAVTSDGATLYVAAFGSSKIGIFSTTELENDTFVPDSARHIEVAGGGPSGMVLDEANNRMYVLKRFTNSVGVINLATNREIREIAMFNPEPPEVVNGRRILYDARHTSSRGNSACGSCHIFGDTDHLTWDLGNPDGSVVTNPNNPLRANLFPQLVELDFHPMKGPMATQSLRGMANHGPLHWRGDRSGGNEPEADPLNVRASFKTFRVAFEGLLGRASPLPEPDVEAFADFALSLTYPPNPIRRIDNSSTLSQARGENFYRNFQTERFASTGQTFSCNGCHMVDVTRGNFGTDGFSVARIGRFGGGDVVKVPHLRNVYTKLGNLENTPGAATGEQYRGFFLNHEGSITTLFNFLATGDFIFPGGDAQRKDVLNFVLAMPSNMAPVVGRQVTLTASNQTVAKRMIDTLERQAAVITPVRECDLVAEGWSGGERRSWLRTDAGTYRSDRASEPLVARTVLETAAGMANQELTFTCVPPGSGTRIALDRDEDGHFNRDELDAGSNPNDPNSVPG